MNKLLLKKIEELTLYLIAKDQEDAKRDAELRKLKVLLKNHFKHIPIVKHLPIKLPN